MDQFQINQHLIEMDNYEELRNIIFNSITWNDLSTLMNTLRLYPIGLEVFNNCLNTPLLYACHCGQSQIVEYLLRLGANYKHLNIFGKSHFITYEINIHIY